MSRLLPDFVTVKGGIDLFCYVHIFSDGLLEGISMGHCKTRNSSQKIPESEVSSQ